MATVALIERVCCDQATQAAGTLIEEIQLPKELPCKTIMASSAF
jgi:hypothetical protein